ncbi:RNA polymerase factor sigma-70 RpoD [Gottschalkia acidurici 9a]|uniref:RNA polymerase factor sigma-70 RpoD n=1 Tax=Gottschalkia acidurici (strain ATCC 7906 / DSM 604 / BCRC 14475 / CIP 104303 / KCTC 5404 / NCIMB 10678 / 9a) TaxID=1128398 RepID=K0AWI6_GOTA9|nr:SigB/SigF/SigG family RNA polymerase sigma factor [Gottschalkia acidurici]AFS77095.1 RNA polymerase factor sigma-70 RpoD [Gottschalkia acidurici 9a]
MNTPAFKKRKDISNIKDKDSKTLFKLYSENKESTIREEIIHRYLYIAEILSKKYSNRGIDYEDIYQVACLGLIYSVDRFDISRGYEFSSFATPTIIGEIKKHFRDKGWAIRVPRRIQELSQKVNLARNTLNQKLQRTPTVKELAEYLDVTSEDVLEAMEAGKVYTPQSLDTPYESDGEDKEVTLADLIGEEDKQFDKIENNDFLSKMIFKLNDVEKKIIDDRYFKRKTQVDIANELGISQMTVSRMEKKIIERFRRELEKSNG